jgi:hypothetical protein
MLCSGMPKFITNIIFMILYHCNSQLSEWNGHHLTSIYCLRFILLISLQNLKIFLIAKRLTFLELMPTYSKCTNITGHKIIEQIKFDYHLLKYLSHVYERFNIILGFNN